jgi:hypothetical protein
MESEHYAAIKHEYDVRLYLVVDDGSGEGSYFAIARDEEHAKELARPTLVGNASMGGEWKDEECLRVVTAETARGIGTRMLLEFWGQVVQEAIRVYHPKFVEDELNSLEAIHGALTEIAKKKHGSVDVLATARAEAALAEREACAEVGDALIDNLGRAYEAPERCAIRDFMRDIRARTTPATLSTETLAAIAEARGLRIVKPGLVTEPVAQAPSCAICGKPASCIGSYEESEWAYACNECCQHGGEDGACVPCGSDKVPELLNSFGRRCAEALSAAATKVLRWTNNGRGDVATVAGLTLFAGNLDWRVEVTKTGKLIDAGVIMADGIVAARFWAARCASEVLDCQIRVEDSKA